MCLAQKHNAVQQVRLEPSIPQSGVKALYHCAPTSMQQCKILINLHKKLCTSDQDLIGNDCQPAVILAALFVSPWPV